MSKDADESMVLAALNRLHAALVPKPEHMLKRELEAWFRGHGYSRTQARTAVAGAFGALKREDDE